jgi:hypothetical protein
MADQHEADPARNSTKPERGNARIDRLFVLVATLIVLLGLGYAGYLAFTMNTASDADGAEMSNHGVFATILGIVLSVGLGVLLTTIFVRGRRREARDENAHVYKAPPRPEWFKDG